MSRPSLVVVEGPDRGVEFEIGGPGGTIGRGAENLVRLTDLAVSRVHCELMARGDRIVVRDTGSRNQTCVNGQPIRESELAAGDEIAIGRTRLVFHPGGASRAAQAAGGTRITTELSAIEALRPAAGEGTAAVRMRDLATMARLGDELRRTNALEDAARVACEAARDRLAADLVAVLDRDAAGRYTVLARAAERDLAAPDDPAAMLAPALIERVTSQQQAVIASGAGDETLIAPLAWFSRGKGCLGMLVARRREGAPPWGEVDLHLAVCMGYLLAAALEGLAARDALHRQNAALVERVGPASDFLGESPAARAIHAFVRKAAPTDSTVLLLGESGVGKEMTAAAIYRASKRAQGPFVCVNCAALAETLLESELFGHERGAFTGATERRAGRFELADGGTLFLDEIGELTPHCQTRFLRALEERRIERVGGGKVIEVDVRVIAATHRDLEQMVAAGTFREDLYYRLSVLKLELPPLRARPEDIPLLAEHFLVLARAQTGRRVSGFTPEALAALVQHPWPGNAR
ncbi:MAG TPA: sigma 54-interacting transcriptional regulator, partial [Kofleriaceae bacterium]|nr:sigma 54-interacting transcriptional regulator [Kofleriaceae bacterium]